MKSAEGFSKAPIGAAGFSPNNDDDLLSEFLPPEREDREELERQRALLFQDEVSRTFFDGFPDGGFILNDKRQIVAVNWSISQRFKGLNEESLLGMRPGEALGCKYAHEAEYGCGTTRFCRYCGAAQVLFQVRMGRPAQEQCHIVVGEIEQDAMDLLVWGTPFSLNGQDFTLFAVADISHEKRRQALERIFFHDVLNTVNGILGAAEILSLKATGELEPWVKSIHESSDTLAREIKAQRQLLSAESGTLEVANSDFLSNDLLKSVVQHCSQLRASQNRTVLLHPDSQDFVLNSDISLLKRVLTNLVKNAVEASAEGERITIKASQTGGYWLISVHNRSFIPIDSQFNLFKRSFSTKGLGRGLGLYSVRLLTEKYLKGRVAFESDPEQGTVFEVILPKER